MLLSDSEIIKAVERGDIFISNFSKERIDKVEGKYEGQLNPSGYNLTLNPKLKIYTQFPLDMKKENLTKEIIIPEEGYVLQPNVLYLGMTNEFTKTCPKYCPVLEGRSSTGRLGMESNICAGMGDPGYEGNWTLEIRVVHPLRVYPNISVCQIMYHEVKGEVLHPYRGKYFGATDVLESKMYKDEQFEKKRRKS